VGRLLARRSRVAAKVGRLKKGAGYRTIETPAAA
jgi:hypothetical protein